MAKEEVSFASPKRLSGGGSSSSKNKHHQNSKETVSDPLPSSSNNSSSNNNNNNGGMKPTSEASMTSTASSRSGGNNSSKSSKKSSKSSSSKSSKTSKSKKDKSKKDKKKSSSSPQKSLSNSSAGKPPLSSPPGSSSSSKKPQSDRSDVPETPKSSKHHNSSSSDKKSSSSILTTPKTESDALSPRTSSRSKRRTATPKKPKKKITFNKTVGVNTIPNLDSFSLPEMEALWFVPDDYARMEDECDETASYMDTGQPLVEEMCPRGLEAWTVDGEQKKEWNVQEAIEKVWQAQLEQWQSAKDTSECWEYIRGEYLSTSKRCSRDARTMGIKDEENVQTYMSTTRSVFESYARRMLGTQRGGGGKTIRRTTSDSTPKAASVASSKQGIGRNRSGNFTPNSKSSSSSSVSTSLRYMGKNENLRSSLKAASVYASDSDEEDNKKKKSSSNSTNDRASRSQRSRKVTRNTQPPRRYSDAMSYASTVESSIASNRKIVFKPRSRVTIPTSPVGSVAEGSVMDESVTSRRMRSHMSVASDDSTRRRMLRSVSLRSSLG
eukprot:scaffold22558_cov116-Cylindrotheca_fusiformis.AAC.7